MLPIPSLDLLLIVIPLSSYVGGRSNGSSAVTNGEDLITEAGGGIVAISLEYRLGVFGQW